MVAAKNLHTPKMGKRRFGNMPQRRLLGLGCPLWVCGQPRPHTFGGTQPQGPWACGGSTPAAQKWQKNRQNPGCHRQTPKCWPKSVGMSKRHGTVQPGAWPSAHTCQQQPQACVCPLRPLGANTSGKTRLTPMGPMAGRPPGSEAQLQDLNPGSESNVEKIKSAFGWPLAHACGCMWLQQIVLGAFIAQMHLL